MDVRNDRGTVIAKISPGIINTASGKIIGYVRDGNITDPSSTQVGVLRNGSIIGADGAEKGLYANEVLSTIAGTILYRFSRTAVLDPDGFPFLGLSEDYYKYIDELISFIVFFSNLWQARSHPMLYPYIHPGFY
ncbi:MAG: hypothetical protein RBG13Loki_2223 [Promethearchaeota archaeon CR_4]|nr:MAG: hypothetical protein RBG13Loki_2223 [Candidatus Lokiarchaeota archaeon CR_4]